jgi:glucosamine--fructose-6-phosphate aminotransferase (isomerizing)
MCGIVGCSTRETAVSGLLVEALKRLEYRGYDSAGIAVLDGGDLRLVRQVGKIANLETALQARPLPGRTGIGHTRWATHGRPSERNAHPHRDAGGAVVVVHNGIIENYLEIKRRLQAGGVEFASDTDTEVIAHLVSTHYRGDLLDAVQRSVAELAGSYALAVIHRDEPDLVVGARQDSPLVVGLGRGANYVASDVSALLPWTRDVIYLEDGDIVAVYPDRVEVRGREGRPVERKAETITWSAERVEKGGYPHFMLKEIHEQPGTVSDCLLDRLAGDDHRVVLEGLRLDDDRLRALTRVGIVACGTSWHAAHVGKFYLERLARLPVEVDYASEAVFRDPVMGDHDLMIAISQSGETADTRAALKRARDLFGAHTLAVCNVPGSSMAREARSVVLTHAGPEIGVASTKAFMGQLVALLLVAMRIGQARGTIKREEIAELAAGLRRLPHDLDRVLRSGPEVQRIARLHESARDFLYIGRGVNFPVALEGALKLKEISYIHAEGYPAGEMKHGPIALIDERMPILAIATRGRTYATLAGNVEEAKARGGRIIAVVNPGDERVAAHADHVLEVPEVHELLSPMVNVVPLQLLAYWIAVTRGTDVDQPRNLAKTVTVQ